MKTMAQFLEELNNKWPQNSDQSWSEMFMVTEGSRYFKICKSRDGKTPISAYAFVNKETGDLYRPASFKAPAKHIRGNINDESGLNACNQYGVQYLR